MSAENPEGAKLGAIFRTIPDAVLSTAVNTTATIAMESVTPTDGAGGAGQDLRGRWVWVHALTSDVTILRKASAPAAAGVGLVITAGAPPVELYIDKGESGKTLSARAAASATLVISWDSEIKG